MAIPEKKSGDMAQYRLQVAGRVVAVAAVAEAVQQRGLAQPPGLQAQRPLQAQPRLQFLLGEHEAPAQLLGIKAKRPLEEHEAPAVAEHPHLAGLRIGRAMRHIRRASWRWLGNACSLLTPLPVSPIPRLVPMDLSTLASAGTEFLSFSRTS
jgi:hypothetical protein